MLLAHVTSHMGLATGLSGADVTSHMGLATGLSGADVTSHMGLATGLLLGGFAVGIYGHMSHSRALILLGIAVIAAISLWLVGAGEVSTF